MKMLASAVLLSSCLALTAQSTPEPKVSPNPLTMEALRIYTEFLNSAGKRKEPVRLDELTEPFEPADGDRNVCLREFALPAEKSIHRFPVSLSSYASVQIVRRDWGQAREVRGGLVTLSEIAFNAKHTRAAFSYAERCGPKCGAGGIAVYELRGSSWVRAKNRCSSWIS